MSINNILDQKCPHCNQPVVVQLAPVRPAPSPILVSGWQQSKTMQSNVEMPPLQPPQITAVGPRVASYERRHPTRAASIEADLLVPLGSALIWSTLLSIPTVALPLFVEGWPWWTPIGCWTILSPLAWAMNSIDFHRTLWTIESATKRDIDGDGHIGQPQPEETTVRLEVTHKNEQGKRAKVSLPTLPRGVTLAMFANWCQQVGSGISTPSEVDWAGRGKPFTKTPYRQFLTIMQDNGVIIKDGPASNSPWVVTAAGRRALPYWARVARNHSERARQT